MKPTVSTSLNTIASLPSHTNRTRRNTMDGKYLKIALVLVLAIGFPIQQANAFNLNFLERSVVSRFNDTDWQMLRQAIAEALNKHRDGSSVSWRNKKSKHSGTVTPFKTTQNNNRKCRYAKLVAHAPQQTESSTFKLCKFNKQWKVVQ